MPDNIPAYGEGDTGEEAIADLKEALRGYIETFGLEDARSRLVTPQLRFLDCDLNELTGWVNFPTPRGKRCSGFFSGKASSTLASSSETRPMVKVFCFPPWTRKITRKLSFRS
jgi:hypothetical protein